ncbi:restriction endonuclease subunit S [Vibrio sp. 10N.222.49.B4]|uniref:restriction endonuclease subunit S n=1 Tax=Vibrio sp. 10N.222.49.B4 TaxID=3229613 RepID=UPI00354C67F1
MGSDWKTFTLEELASEQKSALATGPFGSAISSKFFQENGIPVIRGGNLSANTSDRMSDDGLVFVSEEKAAEFKRSVVRKGDLIFTCWGTINQVGLLDEQRQFDEYIISNKQMKVTLDVDKADPLFVYYMFSGPKKQKEILQNGIGAAVPGFNLGQLREHKLTLPNINNQRRIASYLDSLDQKITLNNQINQTLEQMAQTLFKSWFVDFDPVKAKMNDEQPEWMDAPFLSKEVASLFPEKLDSETGIPVGWSQGVIADIAKLNAKSWTKKNQPEQVHYVDLANTKNGVIETVTSYDFSEAPSRARRILNSGDTIVGTVRPANRSFAFIGDTEQPLTGSTGFAVLSPKEECWTSFVYLATTNDDSIDEYARLADGGAYPAIKPVVVADTPCAIPTKDIAQKFWQLTGSMLKKAHQNHLENEELAKLRDTLLPKLLSGEIDLENVQVEQAKALAE